MNQNESPATDAAKSRNIMREVSKAIGGRWKLTILDALIFNGTLRFNDLRRQVSGITQSMLASQLRELEKDNLVVRKVFAEVPVRVEYSASYRAMELKEVFIFLSKWYESGECAKNKVNRK